MNFEGKVKTVERGRIIPDWEWSWPYFKKKLTKKLITIRQQGCKKKCDPRNTGWNKQLGKFQEGIRRFRLGGKHQCDRCSHFVDRRSVIWDYFHVSALFWTDEDWNQTQYIIDLIYSEVPLACDHQLREAFKYLTGISKLGGRYISPAWRKFCYWETCFGYTEYVEISALKDEVLGWLVTPNVNGEGMGYEKYHHSLYRATVKYLKSNWVRPQNLRNLEEWVERGSWVRGRGGTSEKVVVHVAGKRVKSKSHKGVSAAHQSDANVMADMVRVMPQRMYVMQKSEPAKIRAVAKVDNDSVRKQDFLSTLVEGGLLGASRTTLLGSAAFNEKLDMDILKDLGHGLNVPLDQSAFDNHQGMESLKTVMQAIYDVCIRHEPIDDFHKVWEAMWDSFFHPEASVIIGKERLPWRNGVASGWRWTALLDTLLNIASYDVLASEAARKTGQGFWASTHQGDDIAFKATTVRGVSQLIEEYNNNGYEVHPQKTYISRERTEYLRRSYEKGEGIIGYLGRTLHNILFRNPVSAPTSSKIARSYNRLTTMCLLLLRGARVYGVIRYFLEDCEQLGLRVEDVADFYLTPSCVGGGGLSSASGPLAAAISKYGRGRWLIPRQIETDRPDYDIPLGAWQRRVDELGVKLHPDLMSNFQYDLLRTWGLSEGQVAGHLHEEWWEVPKIQPMNIEGGFELPNSEDLWEDSQIPTMLGPHWKGQLLRDGTYMRYIKEEYRPLVTRISKRISKGLLETYLLGYFKTPSPIIENVSLKYGAQVKKEATMLAKRAMSSNGATRKTYLRKMLWVEEWMKGKLAELSIWGKLAL